MKMTQQLTSVLLIVGIIIVVNILSQQFFFRLDLTADKQYTLSNATKNILQSLEEPVTITAYFSENLPSNIAKTRNDFQDMLTEYNQISKGMVNYIFKNPNEKEESQQEAMQNGVSPVMVNVREKDQMTQKQAFLGAVVEMGSQKDVLPFIQPGAALEYMLSTSIKKISVVDKPVIGWLQGHGEASLQEVTQANASLNILYSVQPFELSDSAGVPANMKTIAIVAPKDSFPPMHFNLLDDFLARGGNIFMGVDRVAGELSGNPPMGSSLTTGLEGWLQTKGITLQNSFLIDANCGTINVMQQQGMFRFATPVQFPYLPIINKFADHPITKGLEAAVLPFASPISYSGDSSKRFTPIAFSSDKSGTQNAPLMFDISKRWSDADFPLSSQAVAGVLEGNLVGSTAARIVVVGDGDFPVNQGQQQAQGDGVNLLVNSIDWLSDDTGLIDLRTKGATSRPIDTMEDGKRQLIKWSNFLVPILFAILYGLFRSQVRSRKRMQRQAERYS